MHAHKIEKFNAVPSKDDRRIIINACFRNARNMRLWPWRESTRVALKYEMRANLQQFAEMDIVSAGWDSTHDSTRAQAIVQTRTEGALGSSEHGGGREGARERLLQGAREGPLHPDERAWVLLVERWSLQPERCPVGI